MLVCSQISEPLIPVAAALRNKTTNHETNIDITRSPLDNNEGSIKYSQSREMDIIGYTR